MGRHRRREGGKGFFRVEDHDPEAEVPGMGGLPAQRSESVEQGRTEKGIGEVGI